VKWELRLSREAIAVLYRLERTIVRNVSAALEELAEDPVLANLQADEDDPSLYWLAVEGDVTIRLEILDERHAIRIVKID
jgi:mRNA-degrading endonuclease RelE of RelBE toxin-antitoxin system